MTTLADRVHEATFAQPLAPGMRWLGDTYGLRTTLRKAKCFYLDKTASEYISDASLTIASHLDEARETARSPYPVIWVDFDNDARIKRMETRGVPLTRRAGGKTDEGAPTGRVGWLIERHPTQHSAHRVTYFTEITEGIVMAPLAWFWDCEGRECPWPISAGPSPRMAFIHTTDFYFGVRDAKCDAVHVIPGWCQAELGGNIAVGLLHELTGELRHVFGLLVTLGHVPTIERDIVSIDGDLSKQPKIVKGKPLFPLVHREILINVPKRTTLEKIVTRVMEGMRKRRHEVRGHWRHFYNEDGTLRRKVWIKNHERGDETLGRVEHGYRVHA